MQSVFISAVVIGNLGPRVAAVGRELVEHARVDAVVLRALPLALRGGGLVDAAGVELGLLEKNLNFPATISMKTNALCLPYWLGELAHTF